MVTETGHEVIFKFPAEELLVAGTRYFRGADFVARTSGDGRAPAGDGRSAARGPA